MWTRNVACSERQSPEFFSHPNMAARYPATPIGAALAQGRHFVDVKLRWNGRNRRLSETRWKLTGCGNERAYFDKGYTNPRRVFISGQKRGVFGLIKRELRRRSAIEP